jgi:diguanylate cyclase (GGDEF)-like protein
MSATALTTFVPQTRDAEEQRTVWELAEPATIIDPDTICEDAERHFARHPESSAVIVLHSDGRLEILTRRRLTVELAGRLGHGRSLYGRRPVWALPGMDETLVLDRATLLSDAAAKVLARRPGHRYDDFVVAGSSGVLATVSVARLFGELARLNEHRAVHDRLTGLPNRELFLQRLQAQVGPAAGLFIDLDDFKAINDSLGHSAGDELLIAVAGRLQSATTRDETVARLSGDEFGILQPGGDEQSAEALALRVERELAAPFALFARTMNVSASIGIAISTGDDIALLLRNADLAMYESKRVGKSRHTVYRDEMFRRASRRLELKSDVDHALDETRLHLVYQPIASIADGKIVGAEALLRWDHPRLGPVAPIEFIELAEESGAIVRIGNWVIAEACRQVSGWGVGVSVNVSPRQLEQPGFAQHVGDALEQAGLDPARLTLEITESAVAATDPVTLTVIHDLAAMGLTLALDDFGTGFSSLERLEQLPIAVLKIDRTFVARLADGTDTRLLSGFLSLAEAMGIDTVVEGVETSEQLQTLAELGYTLAQGFFIGRPVRAEAFLAT